MSKVQQQKDDSFFPVPEELSRLLLITPFYA